MLQSLGHAIEEAANDRAALRRVERGNVGLVISAVDPADPEALELTSYLRRKHPRVPVLLLFANPACDRAREATRLGATVLRYPAPGDGAAGLGDAGPPGLDGRKARDSRTGPAARASALGERAAAESEARAHALATNGHGHGQRNGNGASPGFVDGICPRPGPMARPVLPPIVGEAAGLKQAVETALTAAADADAGRDRRRAGDGQVDRRPGDPRREPAGRPAVRRGRLQRARRVPARARAVRPEVRPLRRRQRHARPARQGRPRPRRDAVPRRGLGADDPAPAPAPPAAPGRRVRARSARREPERADVRFVLASTENLSTLVEQGRFRRELYDRIGDVCLRLPPLRDRGRRHRGAGRALPRPVRRRVRQARRRVHARRPRPALPPRLAGQRPRAGERHPARAWRSARGPGHLGEPLARLRPAPALAAAGLAGPHRTCRPASGP